MQRTWVDHLVVTAPDIDSGARFVHRTLGYLPQPGGEHSAMGTHNQVLRLGESTYLEVIAVNPKAPPPGRPRWFALDLLRPGSPPALAAWVVRTQDIHAAVSSSAETLGTIKPMSRGALEWLITIPGDGMLPCEGAAPALIEWHTPAHPAAGMQEHGLSLDKLEIFHPEPKRILRLLQSIGFEGPVYVSPSVAPCLIARISTPHGPRTL